MSGIAVCPGCGAKNRLGSRTGKAPVCGRCRAPLPWLVDASDQTFDREIETPSPVLVDLWAPWCGPCRIVAPVLEELARDFAGRLKIVKVNVDENPATQGRFQVQGIPTLLLFRAGELRERLVGAQPKAALARAVQAHL